MNVDNQNTMLKNFLNGQTLGKKSLKTSIDQSSITSAGKKSLNNSGLPGHQNNGEIKEVSKKQKKEQKSQSQDCLTREKEEIIKDKNKIERDPMKLLQSF
jgi:hypothetical protein